MSRLDQFEVGSDIAVVGLSCSFPGAGNADQFWANICAGTESVSFFTDEQLAEAGVPADTFNRPNYVKSGFSLAGPDLFDAEFFGYTPLEARIMDPQHRLFLEHSYTALQHAGYDPGRFRGRIGVFGGESSASAYLDNIASNFDHGAAIGDQNAGLGYEGCYLTTRVSYKLDLRGPSVPVQTACSTGLVAVHLACRSLRDGECEMALAGAAALKSQIQAGYLAPPESVLSPDGHVYPFDDAAHGTVFGSGVGVLALKRLDDALAAGDSVYAVIKGSAINNDGAAKASFVSPAVDGQADVILAALQAAGVTAGSIGYVEAHGTGTPVGDRVEIAALTRAYRRHTDAVGFCRIGSVKANVGHLDAAAGMAGIIKVVLALCHGALPPSINVRRPSRDIEFEASPFRIQQELEPWPQPEGARLAGVSAFGFGGTNAHVILAEPPEQAPPSSPDRRSELILLSARTPQALDEATAQFADYAGTLPADGVAELANVAYTLAAGRVQFRHRRILVADDPASLTARLRGGDPSQLMTAVRPDSAARVAFLLTGQGSQYAGMAAELYAAEPVFRAAVESCAVLCSPALGVDITATICAPAESGRAVQAAALLAQTDVAQPALFIVEYAMAQLLESWGIRPAALIGHSLGELVAACLAGVFSVRDALDLIVIRGSLMQAQQPGAMVSIAAEREWVESLLPDGLSLAAHNGPRSCVVAGPAQQVADFADRMQAHDVLAQPVATSRAFHSVLMEPMVADFVAAVADKDRQRPVIPFISNVSGTWITDEEARDPLYWGRHIRACVEFATGMGALAAEPTLSLVEIGPGQTLAGQARRIVGGSGARLVTHALPHKDDPRSAMVTLQRCLGQLWMAGTEPDWEAYYQGQSRRRVALPGYPFQRRRHWLDVDPAPEASVPPATVTAQTDAAPPAGLTAVASKLHPLIDEFVLSSMGESTFATRLDPARHWILAEHKLLGEPTVPGSAFLEIARAAAGLHLGKIVTELIGVDFLVPLVVPDGDTRQLHTRVRDTGPDSVDFRIVSFDPGRPDGQRWNEHARGSARAVTLSPGHRYDVTAERDARGAVALKLPDAPESGQISFGSRWVGMLTWAGERMERAFTQLALSPQFSGEVRDFGLHPALLDLAAGSYGLALSSRAADGGGEEQQGIFLPIGYDRIQIHRPLPPSVICLACPTPGYEQGEQLTKTDIVICDETGATVAEISGFTARLRNLAAIQEELRPHVRHHIIRWREVPPLRDEPQDQVHDEPSGREVLIAYDQLCAAGTALAAELRAAGCSVTEAIIGAEQLRAAAGSRYEVPASQAGHDGLFAALPDRAIDIVVYVAAGLPAAGEAAGPPAQFPDGPVLRLYEFVKAMAAADREVAQLCVVAANVDRITGAESSSAPWMAGLFGLARAVGHEIRDLACRSLDTDETTDMALAARQVLARDGASVIGLRAGRCFVPELVAHIPARATAGPGTRGAPAVDGVCLITGGAGGLGLAAARHLAITQPGVRLALAGRTVLPPREQWRAPTAEGAQDSYGPDHYRPNSHQLAAFREFEELGAQVRYYATDVAHADQVAQLIASVHADLGRIGLVVHCAGLPGDGVLLRKDAAAFAATLGPKMAGAWNLDVATADEAPEMVLFASTIGLFGGVGQSDYTAANSFLDSFASYRSALGRRTIAIDWSDWLDTGMAADHGLQPDSGIFRSLRPSAGLASFDEIRADRETRVVVGELNLPYLRSLSEAEWSWWCRSSPVRLPAELISAVGGQRERDAQPDRPVAAGQAPDLSAPPVLLDLPGHAQVTPLGRPDDSYSVTEIQIALIWGRELDLTELNVFENSFDLGGNSLMALRIAQNIERNLGVRVRMADLFRHATVAGLAAHIDMLREE